MSEKHFFAYGEKELAFLKSKDTALARVIDMVGHIARPVQPDMFMALVNTVIGQQISSKAHITVWERFTTMFPPVTPDNIAAIPPEKMQTCGISMRKVAYIQEIAMTIAKGDLDLAHLHTLDDAAVCTRLSQLKGIGIWTAEMLMIFSMQRPDVLSWGDLAIQRGLRMLHRHKALTRELFAKYKKRYSPYATVASLYLWELSSGKYEGYTDPAPQQKLAAEKPAPAKSTAGSDKEAARKRPAPKKKPKDAPA